MNTPNKDQIVLARIYDNIPEANIAAGMLRSNGIPCILDGETAYGVMGIQLSPTDGVRLMVRECDLAQATQLLDSHDD